MKDQESLEEKFGDRLKRLRLKKGLTQMQLGELLRVSNVQITRYEKGIAKPSMEVIKTLSKALDVRYEDLAGNVFMSSFNLNEIDEIVERLKQLPEQDIKPLVEVMSNYVKHREVRLITSD
ncbi:helix-turn-helix transcriptional regulator [Mucilaginibacter sp. HC2]|uniref:helix-turn-helix domain-containing protein n=1 Tax=Mucilaginibacter inviolabilis TaxID=2714892 RepID=UPI00140D3F69|nr:helix-turn-helix transcriptional regulator [Mucilaginibacter inviolabilis]NHA04889.1 helix-turn-helix transcriptional regulator [Mucilaginibacter inviolabilis]